MSKNTLMIFDYALAGFGLALFATLMLMKGLIPEGSELHTYSLLAFAAFLGLGITTVATRSVAHGMHKQMTICDQKAHDLEALMLKIQLERCIDNLDELDIHAPLDLTRVRSQLPALRRETETYLFALKGKTTRHSDVMWHLQRMEEFLLEDGKYVPEAKIRL